MKLHGVFTQEVINVLLGRIPSVSKQVRDGILSDIMFISRMGVLPEGAEVTTEVRPVPVPPPVLHDSLKPAPVPAEFSLGTRSLELLKQLKPELARCVELAITKSATDFRVNQTVRSVADQVAAVHAGHSRTMKSKHLIQPDGFAWACDLVALDSTHTVTWNMDSYTEIAMAMDEAATELGIAGHVRWGCAWDRVLSDFGGSVKAYADEIRAYEQRHAGSDLIDAPHFEWVM